MSYYQITKVFEAVIRLADMKAANATAEALYRSAPFSLSDLEGTVMSATADFNEAVRLAVIEALGGR